MLQELTSYDLRAWYAPILEPFKNPQLGPGLATILLGLAALVFLLFAYDTFRRGAALKAALRAIRGTEKQADEAARRLDFKERFSQVDADLLKNRVLSNAWREFRETLIHEGRHQNLAIANSTRPQNFFHPRTVGAQYDLARSLPNIFVGLGLLGTFIGLIAALSFSTQSLTDAADPAAIKQALKELLTTAASKFYISAAGLVSSIILSLYMRLRLKKLHASLHAINEALEERLLYISDQTISEQQLLVQTNALQELKLFNTDMAMAIGNAVHAAMDQSNAKLAEKLDRFADGFARLVNETGKNAGDAVNNAMQEALKTSLQEASDKIQGVASSLANLPTRLETTLQAINRAGENATAQQKAFADELGKQLQAIVADAGSMIGQNLDEGTKGLLDNLSRSGSSFGSSATALEGFISTLSEQGTLFTQSFANIVDIHKELEENLSTIVRDMQAASSGMTKVTSTVNNQIEKVLSGFEAFSATATSTTTSIRDSQKVIADTALVMQEQMSAHIKRFDSVDEKLAGVFGDMGTQLDNLSRQMADRLTEMDSQLASAVQYFSDLVDEIKEIPPRKFLAEAGE